MGRASITALALLVGVATVPARRVAAGGGIDPTAAAMAAFCITGGFAWVCARRGAEGDLCRRPMGGDRPRRPEQAECRPETGANRTQSPRCPRLQRSAAAPDIGLDQVDPGRPHKFAQKFESDPLAVQEVGGGRRGSAEGGDSAVGAGRRMLAEGVRHARRRARCNLLRAPWLERRAARGHHGRAPHQA